MIRLVLNYARSGGTLLNKCLASLSDTMVFSEINPIREKNVKFKVKDDRTLRGQAAMWYGINLSNDDFQDNISELLDIAQQRNKKIVIRDWSYINFYPANNNNFKPSNSFLLIDALSKYKLKSISFVRDSIDVWISRGRQDLDLFFNSYLNYIEELKKLDIPIYKYEDFVQAPEKTFCNICNKLELNYEYVFAEFFNVKNIKGDTDLKASRGANLDMIKKLPRKNISFFEVKKLNKCEKMIKANQLLQYPNSFGKRKFNLDLLRSEFKFIKSRLGK